jgi:hypothetical protein
VQHGTESKAQARDEDAPTAKARRVFPRVKAQRTFSAQFERGTHDELRSLGSACAKASRPKGQRSRRLLDLCRRHGSDISCARALTPSAAMWNGDWHCAELGKQGSRQLRNCAIRRPTERQGNRQQCRRKQRRTCSSIATLQWLQCQRAFGTRFPRHGKSAPGANGDGDGNVNPRAN